MSGVESSIDDRLTTAIRSLQFEKGTRDERLGDPGFTKTVLSRFEDICKSNLIRSWIFALLGSLNKSLISCIFNPGISGKKAFPRLDSQRMEQQYQNGYI